MIKVKNRIKKTTIELSEEQYFFKKRNPLRCKSNVKIILFALLLEV